MSRPNSDQLHRSTLAVYTNIMEQFNPGLQKMVSLGNIYMNAFQELAAASEAYFSMLAKMGGQALHSMSSYSLGDILIQMSDSQRRLTAELEGVFRWFHAEVLLKMENNVRLDKDYISSSRRRYEVEVRNQAMVLERQLRRGANRSVQDSSYMQFLWQSQQEAVKEEERRYRFLAEKHCGLTQSIIYLMNKTGVSLQQHAEKWRERVNESRSGRPRTPSHVEQGSAMWEEREEQMLSRGPSRGPSPPPGRSRSSSLGDPLGPGAGRQVRALVPHTTTNPTLLPFSRGELITVLVAEPRNGWLYGRAEGSARVGWFPAAYIGPPEETPKSSGYNTPTLRSSHSMTDLVDLQPPHAALPAPPSPPPLPSHLSQFRPVAPSGYRKAGSSVPENKRSAHPEKPPELFPRGSNPFATVKLRPTATNDRSAPRV